MLDDLKYIHQKDSQDALGIAEKQCDQYLHNFKFAWKPDKTICEIMVAGMGGSGLAAKAYATFGGLQVPFSVIQDYDLPERADENTLVICISYSGNTEETLSVFNQAIDPERPEPKPMVAVVSSGGKLLEQAKKHNLPFIELPANYQPRYTFGFQYRALTELIASTSLTDGALSVLEQAAKRVRPQLDSWRPDTPTKSNQAKQIALDVIGKSVVIYSSSRFFPAAYKWKINFNENAKNIAWCSQYPEFNHNEFLGWTSHPLDKPYAVIDLQSSFDNAQIKKRFEVSAKLLSGKRPHPITVNAKGDSPTEQLIWLNALGDFVSLYTALLNGLNPTPVDLIEKLKQELA